MQINRTVTSPSIITSNKSISLGKEEPVCIVSEYRESYVAMDNKFRLNWDAHEGLPETPKEEILDWRLFNENMYSVDPKVDDAVNAIMDENEG
jgi:hypothetical protein